MGKEIVLHNAPTMTQCKIAAQPPITTIHKVSSMPPRQYLTSSPRVAHHNINPLPRLAGAAWQYHSPVLAARMLSVVQGLKSFRNRIRTAELCCDFSVSSYQTVKESGRSSCYNAFFLRVFLMLWPCSHSRNSQHCSPSSIVSIQRLP